VRPRPTDARAASAAESSASARAMKISPSCVRLIRRVVRCSSRAPSWRSSCAMRALATAADTPNSRPAAVTFASSAARTNSPTSSRSSGLSGAGIGSAFIVRKFLKMFQEI